LDAGANLTFAGPSGTRPVPPNEDDNAELLAGVYVVSFDSRHLPPGSYEIHNGDGGAQVGPFRIPVPITDSDIEWTNRDGLAVIRGADVTLTWEQTGAPEDGLVRIYGNFLTFRFNQNGYGLGGSAASRKPAAGNSPCPHG
jgi:hypothetical protein